MKIWLTAFTFSPRLIGKGERRALRNALGVDLRKAAGFDAQCCAALARAGAAIMRRCGVWPVLDHMKGAAVAQVPRLDHLPGIAQAQFNSSLTGLARA